MIKEGLLWKIDRVAEVKEEVIKICPLFRAQNKTEIKTEQVHVDVYKYVFYIFLVYDREIIIYFQASNERTFIN